MVTSDPPPPPPSGPRPARHPKKGVASPPSQGLLCPCSRIALRPVGCSFCLRYQASGAIVEAIGTASKARTTTASPTHRLLRRGDDDGHKCHVFRAHTDISPAGDSATHIVRSWAHAELSSQCT
ncbi:hypothetical protein XA68_13410 [Ophiocordyceps unilateralis]|uniref:Uncharacterized protein n=1 Tax=Ophiocordyceps unilateralis TaxID=268505 RepID=A0A2A9PBS7_OPHUN|nr:hypothetical protein XA68_13410 [Ophiocordyceps unilateralis]